MVLLLSTQLENKKTNILRFLSVTDRSIFSFKVKPKYTPGGFVGVIGHFT